MPESMKMYTSMLGEKKSVSVDYFSQMFEETRIYKSPLKMYWILKWSYWLNFQLINTQNYFKIVNII